MMTNRMVKGTGAALLALSGAAEAAYQWNLPTPVTRVAGEIYNLHLIMMGIILVIFVMMRRSEEHTSELQSLTNLVCRLLLEKKKRQPACCPYLPAPPLHEKCI